ncbi:hypothetical protein BY458DRAFT_347241 [Sporodiniella umbellata]|nr:hypothetical protein BY458DRAFT_347241 [Sporodiniella umbellata]
MYDPQGCEAFGEKVTGDLMLVNGTIPLIITAPHGGWKRPESIPDRVRDGSLILRDLYTKEIAETIQKKIMQHYKQSPFVVFNLVSRRKADTNRPIEEGTETEAGRKLWCDYHNSIKSSIESLHKKYSFGILIDIHVCIGHTHKHGMIELGYLLEPDDIKQSSPSSLSELVLQKSSIQSLAQRCQTVTVYQQVLHLFGDRISELNVPAVPSTTNDPDDFLYFHGAYTTQTYHFHSKKDNKGMDAVQIEIPQKFRLNSEGREQAAQAISKAVIFLLDNYYMNIHKL